jgi:hypothetical protein
MIEIIAVILLVIAWFVLAVATCVRFGDHGATDLKAWVYGGVAVWMSAWVINAMLEHERDNPCVAYESRLTYNSATKTMMPMRVCVERGEWENNDEL